MSNIRKYLAESPVHGRTGEVVGSAIAVTSYLHVRFLTLLLQGWSGIGSASPLGLLVGNAGCQSSPQTYMPRPWGCYNKLPQTGGLKQQISVSHCSGGWKSKIKIPANSFSGDNTHPGFQTAVFLLCPHMAAGERESSSVSSYKGTGELYWIRAPP